MSRWRPGNTRNRVAPSLLADPPTTLMEVLTTDQKGAAAELAIAHAAAELGVGVFKPLTDGERYDLIFDFRPRLMRIQCKWAPLDGQTVIVRCYSNRRAREGLRRRSYTASEADAIAAYCPALNRCFFIPATRFDGHSQLLLRLAPSRNNQRLGVNWADEFELGARLESLRGAVAQLGERSDGIRKVRGSIPPRLHREARTAGVALRCRLLRDPFVVVLNGHGAAVGCATTTKGDGHGRSDGPLRDPRG